jgi:hypothetical protein
MSNPVTCPRATRLHSPLRYCPDCPEGKACELPLVSTEDVTEAQLLNDIAVMMGEFVDNWPNPKKVSTALALIAKTIRASLGCPICGGKGAFSSVDDFCERHRRQYDATGAA